MEVYIIHVLHMAKLNYCVYKYTWIYDRQTEPLWKFMHHPLANLDSLHPVWLYSGKAMKVRGLSGREYSLNVGCFM